MIYIIGVEVSTLTPRVLKNDKNRAPREHQMAKGEQYGRKKADTEKGADTQGNS